MIGLREQIACAETLEQAFGWMCRKREHYSPNSAVWDLRRHWDSLKPTLQQRLLDGTYELSPLQEIRLDKETLELWASLDALVLKAVTQTLAALKLEKHRDKTFIARIDKGLDFPGYKFVERLARLYEHGAEHCRIGRYVQHWLLWATTGVSLASPGLSQLRPPLTNIVALCVNSPSLAVARVS